jgi:hypothetical protein
MRALPRAKPESVFGQIHGSRHHRLIRTTCSVVGPALLILFLAGPMIWDRGFLGIDWYSHLWYLWHEAESLRVNQTPSLFAHNSAAVFDPHFTYYGGTLYVLGGVTTVIVGSPEAALDLWFLLGFACSYGGWCWLARLAGLRGAVTHAPGVLFISSAYYLATIYGAGGWSEAIAVASIPLLLASAWSVQAADHVRLGSWSALVASSVLFTGSHNLTLLWGTTFLGVTGAVILRSVPSARRMITWRGVRRVALAVAPAVLINAWFLLPDLAFQSRSAIAHDQTYVDLALAQASFLVGPEQLLSLTRGTADPAFPYYVFSLPLLVIGWLAGSLVIARSAWRKPAFRVVLALLIIMVILVVLLGSVSLLRALPSPWGLLQAGYRLEAYVHLALGGAVIAALVLLANQPSARQRRWSWVLLPVALVSVVQGRQQVTDRPSGEVAPVFLETTLPYLSATPVLGSSDYAEFRVPLLEVSDGGPVVRFEARDAERGNRVTEVVAAAPGDVVRSNLVAAPSLISITGARIVARDSSGTSILQIDDDATPGAAEITVQTARSWPVVMGAVLSALGLAGIIAGAAFVILGRRETP